MEHSEIFWGVIGWMILWGVVGGLVTRRIYLHKDLDTSNSVFVGSMLGAATGPVGLAPLWIKTPEVNKHLMVWPAVGAVTLIAFAFAFVFSK